MYHEDLPPNTPHVRMFGLFPYKADYNSSFVFINKTTLALLLDLLDKSAQRVIVRSMILCIPQGSASRVTLENRLTLRSRFFTGIPEQR